MVGQEAKPRVNSVAIELTAHCNQKCDYCYNAYRSDGGAAVGAAELDVLLRRLDRLFAAFDIDHVTLTGGEPFARSDLFAVLDRVRAANVGVQIISNGGLVTRSVAARLAGYGVHYVQVTLNGPDAELHEEHVGPGHFSKTISGIRALVDHGVPVVGCVVLTRKNAGRVRETLELFQTLGVRRIALSRFSPAGYAASRAAELLCSRSDLLTAFGQALPFARELGMDISCTMPVPPCAVETEAYAPIGFGVCPIGTSMQEFALGADGALRNCTLHRAPIGAVADIADPDVDLAALVRSPMVTEYRSRVPAFCEGCVHASTCGGGCGAAAEWLFGDARGFPDPTVWQHVDDAFAARLAEDRAAGKRRLETIR
jgi:radical SAM protein with 4Fe4S-binding SPASM domain